MKYCVLIFVFIFQLGFSQSNYEVERLPSRIRVSGEFVNMESEDNIGFLGHGYEMFGLFKKYPNVYFGVNSYAAITGIRSGFIVFGVSGGVQKYIYKDWLSYDLGLFLGGGGGSGAPDGGGLMIRPHLDFQIDVNKKLALRTGVSGVEFPSGEISSFNVTVGAVIKTNTYLANTININKPGNKKLVFNSLDVSALSSNLFNYSKGPLKNNSNVDTNAPTISLLGALIKSRHRNSNFYGTLKLGGAFMGDVDGFMMLLTGLGYELPVANWLSLDAKALVGGAGGGFVDFGGGFATQVEGGLSLKFSDYSVNLNLGSTFAPNGNFQSNHIDLALGKRFDLYGNPSVDSIEVVDGENLVKEDFYFSVFNRVYASGDKVDKKERPYDSYFNLLGFEVGKKLNDNFSVLATTVWAYQGNYGAYAEGWLGLGYNYAVTDKLALTAKGLVGAGGGGDIDLGSGLAYQYTLGLDRKINKRWNFIANIGQVRGVSGNFTPFLLDVGVKLNLSQLVKI